MFYRAGEPESPGRSLFWNGAGLDPLRLGSSFGLAWTEVCSHSSWTIEGGDTENKHPKAQKNAGTEGTPVADAKPAAMLPDHELDTFLVTVTDAVDLARAGEIADGYTALLGGLHRAREIADAGELWAAELVRRYHEAVENYAREWRVGRG